MTIAVETSLVKTPTNFPSSGSLPAATTTTPGPDLLSPVFNFDEIVPLSLPLSKAEEQLRQNSCYHAQALNNALKRPELCLKFTVAEVCPHDGNIHARRYTCDLWTCPHCAPRMRNEWLARLCKAKIRAVAVFKPSDIWYNIQQRIKRLQTGVEHCHIWHNDRWYLFLSKRVDPRDLYPALKSTELISYFSKSRQPKLVQECLEMALSPESSPLLGKHKVNTTRGFFPTEARIPRPPRTKSHDKMAKLLIHMGLDKLAELAMEEGGTVIWWSDNDITIMGWSLPPEWFREASP